jgi:hypothetical protein
MTNETKRSIGFMDFQRLFQLFVPALYDREEKPQPHYTHIALARQVFGHTSPAVANQLRSPYVTLVDSCFFSRESGGLSVYCEYEQETPEVGLEQFAAFCLAESFVNRATIPASVKVVPYFTFAAKFDFSGQVPALIAQDVQALIVPKSRHENMNLDQNSLRKAFCYANGAFLQILAGKPVDITKNIQAMEMGSAGYFQFLTRNRTYDRLMRDVQATARNSPLKTNPYAPVM